ncbi:MAG TPA: ADP-ribosylglycohydrolase family protein [Capsulimonadaceae bacterium]|jgi:ADP-ribosylglycohydrolase
MTIPNDYAERVYAGVLGKIIGVYLGRPFEGWSYEKITERFVEITRYVHEDQKCQLIVADDDISGTFSFFRAFEDFGYDSNLTPRQIGQTWLNYIIENRTILWWGGMGMSTEHTAFIRIKNGVPAPQSGSIETNSKVVAEQIGAQIFIDAWGMLCPGDPARAADFARRAGSVSHDGEAIYGAQVVAALVSAAFVEQNIDSLLDTAVELIPSDSIIATLIADIRQWRLADNDWRKTREKIDAKYGYHIYGGNCHMVPNHALIILALVYGNGDLTESLKIVNTCGWDTDCNSGNVGAILGVRNGLAGLTSGYDWRTPVADRLFLPTADGGRGISDAVIETRHIVNAGRSLAGVAPEIAKGGARFAFEFPGSVQGFIAEDNTLTVSNPNGAGLSLHGLGRVSTPTYVPADVLQGQGYSLIASPTLFSGQTLRGTVTASAGATVRPYVRYYGPGDKSLIIDGPVVDVDASGLATVAWLIPDTQGQPIFQVGLDVLQNDGDVTLQSLTWDSAPNTSFAITNTSRTIREQWICGIDQISAWTSAFALMQNSGRGVMSIGTKEWTDYRAEINADPHMVDELGVVARYQGMERYYALILNRDGKARLIKRYYGDTVLADTPFDIEFGKRYDISIEVAGDRVVGFVNGTELVSAVDASSTLAGGGMGVLLTAGRAHLYTAKVSPL